MSRSQIGWLKHLETGWKTKFDFQRFLKIFGKIRTLSWARVSCLCLYTMLGIYREDLERKKSEKRFDLEHSIFFK